MLRTGLRLLAATTFLLAAACTKSEPPASVDAGAPTPSAATSAAASASPSASPSAAASASAAADPSAAPSASATTAAAPGKDGGSTPAASSSAAAAPECGKKPLPDCPLQAWMKSNANPPVMNNDAPALATAFDKIAALAPPGYTNWASISKDGAKTARAGDVPGAKASCRTCHDQYKEKYKTEMRARKL